MGKLKSTDVYREIRTVIGPWCRANGFKRKPGGMLAYVKLVGTNYLVFWFQVSLDGWDDYAGSKFIVEFQLSDSQTSGSPSGFRARIPRFLKEIEFARIRHIQDSVIASLPKPPTDHPALMINPETSTWYLKKFKPIAENYDSMSDIWFRYHQLSDIRIWAELVASVLPRIVGELENMTLQPSPRRIL